MADLKILKERAAIISAVRSFFEGRGYFEVQTPVRLPSIAPEPFIEPITSEGVFLQTSPELCMKRLLARGAEKIFQICPCFRKGERGRLHLPEFTMLEWYRVGADYLSLMDECEMMIRQVAAKGAALKHGGWNRTPWERMTVVEAFANYGPLSVEEAIAGDRFEEVLVEHVEPALARMGPVFLYDYPASMASLSRLRQDNPAVSQRFELYMNGIEIANGFTELNDPEEQGLRFAKDRDLIFASGREPGPVPEKFLDCLGTMPDSAGIALGLDRLVLVLTGAVKIDDVVSFIPENL